MRARASRRGSRSSRRPRRAGRPAVWAAGELGRRESVPLDSRDRWSGAVIRRRLGLSGRREPIGIGDGLRRAGLAARGRATPAVRRCCCSSSDLKRPLRLLLAVEELPVQLGGLLAELLEGDQVSWASRSAWPSTPGSPDRERWHRRRAGRASGSVGGSENRGGGATVRCRVHGGSVRGPIASGAESRSCGRMRARTEASVEVGRGLGRLRRFGRRCWLGSQRSRR